MFERIGWYCAASCKRTPAAGVFHAALSCLIGIVITTCGAAVLAQAEQPVQPLPRPAKGQCPSGYASSGAYCAPMRDAKAALPKVERAQCPSGYYTSGSFCLASSREAREAVPKVGQCPSGYYSSGDYCLRTQAR